LTFELRGLEYSRMHNAKTFGEIEVGSVFRLNGKNWQKVSEDAARDLNPPPPMEIEKETLVETLYEHQYPE